MSVPEHLWRFPTQAAIASLAKRFCLPNTPEMQDWEWEVADCARIDEFCAAYLSGELTEDERFVLMETLLQSFEELDTPVAKHPAWQTVLELLDRHVELHGRTIWYWSNPGCKNLEDSWRITPFVRSILARHKQLLKPPDELDGATVLWWTFSFEPFFVMADGGEAIPIHGLAVCRYESGKVYRFSCDCGWEVQSDCDFGSVHEALTAPSAQYEIASLRWERCSERLA